MSRIEPRDGVVRIGALCTHAELERSDEIKDHLPLVAEAVQHIAHPAIRNRGTIGGSLALADPAAELPACAVALEAVLLIAGRKGERRVTAAEFFKGLFETDLQPGEVLAAVEFPKAEKSVFLELTRRQGDYAIVGVAGVKKGAERRFAFFGIGGKPVLLKPKSLEEGKASLPTPAADLYHAAATKLHLAKVLLERAWNKL
jgi:aerobic carbon-monoxide dehydrogenase medium subunit